MKERDEHGVEKRWDGSKVLLNILTMVVAGNIAICRLARVYEADRLFIGKAQAGCT